MTRNPFLRKPISFSTSESQSGITRHMTLLDLVYLGLGGTIGSGIFVLSGQIAHNQAGAATPICFLISGFCAVLSGCCYAELSANIPGECSNPNPFLMKRGALIILTTTMIFRTSKPFILFESSQDSYAARF